MGLIARLGGGKWGMALSAVLLLLASPLLAPQVLAFPYKTETELGTVWSETRLDPAMLESAIAAARSRLDTSPLARDDEQRWIFITNGGWRWAYVANTSQDAFALTRAFSPMVIVNATDPDTGIVTNGRDIGGERTLGSVIAHEFAHGLIRREYGFLRARTFPTWKVEGYCDHVADESSLSAEEAALLRARDPDHPALVYFDGRQKVQGELAVNGGSVDALFTGE